MFKFTQTFMTCKKFHEILRYCCYEFVIQLNKYLKKIYQKNI